MTKPNDVLRKNSTTSCRKLCKLLHAIDVNEHKEQQKVKEHLYDAFREFFEHHREARSIIWTQYASSRNDTVITEFEVKANAKHFEPDIEKIVEGYIDDNDDYYNGEACVVMLLRDTDENSRNKYYSNIAFCRTEHQLRQLTAKEISLCDDFEALERACMRAKQFLLKTFGSDVKVVASAEGFDITDLFRKDTAYD